MKRLEGALALAGICLLLAAPTWAAPDRAVSAPPERAWGTYDPTAERIEQLERHAVLTYEQAREGVEDPVRVSLGKRQRAAVEEWVPGERPVRVGVYKRLGLRVDFARKAQPFGAIRTTFDGGFVWSGSVRSEGASALRLRFTGFNLPAGHELFIYSAAGQVQGPFTGRGPSGDGRFWSPTLFGAEAIVQVHGPAAGAPARFNIRRLAHVGSKFRLARYAAGERPERFVAQQFCSFNEPCIENINCTNPDSAVAGARDAVAQILFPSQGGFFICTGGLLADTDNSTQRSLFLTANHCISRGSEAAGSESFFQFEVNCNAACVDFDNGSFPSVAGASILAKGKQTDFTLLELGGPAPGGSAFLGWNSTPVAFNDGQPLFRVSHPGGAPQAYSEQEVDVNAGTCGGWPRGNRIYSRDTFGGTEGGSSGSPVVNAAGEVVGQLTGACGTNVGDPCDAGSNATVDGAFAAYFSSVESILDPGGGDPGGGECTPGPGAKGDACTQDEDCQSCKCKGPSGSQTCK